VTVAEGGNRRWAEIARQNAFQSRWPRADQGQSVVLTNPLGVGNWQLTQKTVFEMRNKTGSYVFIAASTMATRSGNRRRVPRPPSA